MMDQEQTGSNWWAQPACLQWVELLLASFHHWTGGDLLKGSTSAVQLAQEAFEAPFAIVSHGCQHDPILNYGNRVALDLWEMTWEEFSRTPSRLTAEPVNQMERDRMLAEAHSRGYISDYQGVRISKTGRRFLIVQAVVWNVVNADMALVGQGATFSRWRWLD